MIKSPFVGQWWWDGSVAGGGNDDHSCGVGDIDDDEEWESSIHYLDKLAL